MGNSQKKENNQKKKFIKYLLEDDIIYYRDFINEIEKFKKIDLENLFDGNYESNYPIKNKKSFQEFVKIFCCYSPIIKEWYNDETKHIYIKKLWKKRIAFKKILLSSDLEKEIKAFLNKLDFPENLIDKSIELILLNSNFAIEEEENIKMKYPGISDLFDRIHKLKLKACRNIKYNYIKNNSLFDYLRQNSDIILKEIIGLFPITTKIKDIIYERIQNNSSKIKNNGDLGKIAIDIKNLKKEEKDIPKNFNFFSIGLKFIQYYEYVDCFIRIPDQFKELKNIFKEEEFNRINTKLDEIQNNFNSHNKIVKLTNNPQIDLKNLDEKIKNIENDFNQLKKLITEIDNNLSLLYENRNRNIIFSIFNGIFVGLNIALMIVESLLLTIFVILD